MFIYYNPNPKGKHGIDCTVRAITKVTGDSWRDVYWDLCNEGNSKCNMPTSDEVWGGYLRKRGFVRRAINDTCPDCYTVIDFANDHLQGEYVLCAKDHVVAVKDGNYFDIFNSGHEPIYFYWEKERTVNNGLQQLLH